MIRRVIMFLVCAIPLATSGAAPKIPPEVRQAARAREQAIAKKDGATWDRLTTADFIVVLAEGKLLNKAEHLAQLKAEKPEPVSKPKQEQFIRSGDTIIQQ